MLPLLLAAATPLAAPRRFDALRFFTGATEGRGRLKIALRRARAVSVHGNGRLAPDGAVVLDQRVEQAGQAPTRRRWRIREDRPGHYTGTLTDATGPVIGEARGDRLHLYYRAKHGVRIDQWLTLSPDGRSARNHLAARKLGVVVARLDETIRKTD